MYKKLATVVLTRYMKDSPYLKHKWGETWQVTVNIGGLNKHPEVSVTGDVYRGKVISNRTWQGGGCMHDEIVKYFPEIMPLIRWHLWDIQGAMHYVENALYQLGWCGWWGTKHGVTVPNTKHFVDTVNWGILPGEDQFPDEWIATNDSVLANHAEGLRTSAGWYIGDNPEFDYIRDIIGEATNKIRTVLLDRLPAVRGVMLDDLETFYQAHGYAPGEVTRHMYKEF